MCPFYLEWRDAQKRREAVALVGRQLTRKNPKAGESATRRALRLLFGA